MEETMVFTSEDIPMIRLITLKHALKLECKGLSRRGVSVYALVKREFGFKGNKARVLAQLTEHIEAINAARSTPAHEE